MHALVHARVVEEHEQELSAVGFLAALTADRKLSAVRGLAIVAMVLYSAYSLPNMRRVCRGCTRTVIAMRIRFGKIQVTSWKSLSEGTCRQPIHGKDEGGAQDSSGGGSCGGYDTLTVVVGLDAHALA